MLKEFKAFIMRGNMLDMAVGIIMGAAFGRIVSSLVNDILMPPIGLLLSRVNFSNLFITLSGGQFDTLAAAQQAGAVTINYGLFINAVIDFLIVSLAVFWLISVVNRLYHKPKEEPAPPTTKTCPYCMSTIDIKATRCPFCTSDLTPHT